VVTRIIGIPDANGIIRVACGSDVIEIVVATIEASRDNREPREEREKKPESPSAPPSPPPKSPKWSLPPWVRPIPMWVHPAALDADAGTLGIDADLGQASQEMVSGILDSVLNQQRSPSLANPTSVMLKSQHIIDIHAVQRLARAMKEHTPGVALGVTFGEDG
jgi:hypothetical protein